MRSPPHDRRRMPMDPAEYQRARELFHRIAELPPEEQRAQLEAAGLSDEGRALVDTLLGADEETSLLGDASGSRVVERLVVGAEQVPERIGEYRVEGVLGRGGMGVVYRAVQDRPRREVAIKVLNSFTASPAALRRFEYEAEILGQLDHPCIAKVFQARVDGSGGVGPYLVMELVDGTDIVTWCDAHALDDRRRVELVQRLCEGVEHAHQRGVVHRDLKPANVLVSADGRPRILDFGIARPLMDDGNTTPGRTLAGEVVGSLSWMSPEQARGEVDRIDVRTDVYSLGVILYRLLTGRMPHELGSEAVWEAARRISEDDPTRLGRIRKELRGDLEAIVSMALEKDPARRYGGAGALARDLERYLAHEPVDARPWSGAEQLRKLARRHRVLLGTAALVLVSIVAGLVATFVQWRRAEDETLRANTEAGNAKAAAARADLEAGNARDAAARADEEARRAEENAAVARDEARTSAEVVDFLVDLFDKSAAYTGDDDLTVRELLDVAEGRIDREFETEPRIRARLLATMGVSYGALGLLDRGDRLTELAVETASRALDEDDRVTYDALSARGRMLAKRTRYDDARALFERCIEGYSRLLGPHAAETLQARQDRLQTLLWSSEVDAGLAAEVEAETRDLLAAYDRSGRGPGSARRLLATFADFLLHQGRVEEAEAAARDALVRGAAIGDGGSPEALRLQRLLATAAGRRGAPGEALALLEEAQAAARETLPPEHPAVLTLEIDLGLVLLKLGRAAEADGLLTHAAGAAREVLGDESLETQRALFLLANLRKGQGRIAEAAEIFETVWRIEREQLGPHHPTTLESELSAGAALAQLGRFERALEHFESVYAGYSGAGGPTDPRASGPYMGVVQTLAALGRWERFHEITGEVIDAHVEAFGDDDPRTLRVRLLRSAFAVNESRSDASLDALERDVQAGRVLTSADPIFVIGLGQLVHALIDEGRAARAVPYAEELVEGTPPGAPTRPEREAILERARAAAR